jgi:hypothetical protein
MVSKVPLWPCGVELDIIGVFGPPASGKTVFGLSICPSETYSHDLELGQKNYAKVLKFKRVDVHALARERKDKYTDLDFFQSWYADAQSVEKGQYRVGFIDPIEKLESGMTDYIANRYSEFGYKTREKFTSTGGIFWSYVTAFYNRTILDYAAKFECFVFANHLRKVWKAGKATDDVEPKGKSTLQELASLRLYMDRSPRVIKGVGLACPPIPSATLFKERLATARTYFDDSGNEVVDMKPYLPDVLPEATPQAIRKYILNPPDFDNLKPEETVQEKQLSEADTLELKARIAADSRAAAEAEREKTLELSEMEQRRQAALASLRPTSPEPEKDANVVEEEAVEEVPLTETEILAIVDNAKAEDRLEQLLAFLRAELDIDDGSMPTFKEIMQIQRSILNDFLKESN